MTIQAIETVYNGYRFRSRTEARFEHGDTPEPTRELAWASS